MKNNVFKKIIVVGIITLIIGIVIACILIINNSNEEILDKPLTEITMKDFKKVKVELGAKGFDNPDYKEIYEEYLKPKYSNITVFDETFGDINVILTSKKNLGDEMEGKEVLDLKPFIENEIFGINNLNENNFSSIYMEYVYRLSEEDVYAIPEYINLPCIIYNSAFAEILDISIPNRWSELALVKSELMNFADYKDHIVAGYDKEHFDIVSAFVKQGYDEEVAKYIIESWEKNGIIKGYDKMNISELSSDLPIIFIMPNSDTISALKENSCEYAVSGMLLDDNEMIYINVNDGKHGKYISVLKGANVYEDIAGWLYLKGSIDTKDNDQLSIKPFSESNVTSNSPGEYYYIMLQLLSTYEKMYENGQIVFYQK